MANIFDELIDSIRNPNAPPSVFGPRGAPSPPGPPLLDPSRVAKYQQISPNLVGAFNRGDQGPPAPTDIEAALNAVRTQEREALDASPSLVDVPSAEADALQTAEDAALDASPPLVEVQSLLDASPPLVEIPSKGKSANGKKPGRDTKRDVVSYEQTAAAAEKPEDELLAGYKGKAGDLEKQRIKALEQAAAEKDLSNEEKVAMALLAALPGLIGAIGGGAIAGGYGAAAGAAGGLKGGAEGVQMIAQSKEGRRKEAKGAADKLLDQITQQEGLATRRQETLEGRDIDEKKTAAQFAHDDLVLERKLAADRANTGAQTAATLAAAKMGAESRDYNALLDFLANRDKAVAAAKAGHKPTEHQLKLAQLYPQIALAVRSMDKLDDTESGPPQASTASNLYNKVVPRALESDEWREYEDAAAMLAQHGTFAVSGAQAPETEVARMKDFYAARPSDSPARRQQKRAARNAVKQIVLDVAEGRLSPGEAARKAEELGLGLSIPGGDIRPVDAAAATKAKYGF
jgi:hypothetical protein